MSVWHFTHGEAHHDAAHRIRTALWEFACNRDINLPPTAREKLTSQLLAVSKSSHSQTEQRSRPYGDQYRQTLSCSLSMTQLDECLSAFQASQVRQTRRAGLAAASTIVLLLITFLLAILFDRRTRGYRLSLIGCLWVLLSGCEVTGGAAIVFLILCG
ncbi:MAG: hypothetical protein O3A00_07835 [Planctomycetota bacterium]|nr:hypothetical protein [Planctomycetota bacterium]